MKRKSYGDLSTFAVIAERDGVELGRCQIEALDEDDAFADRLYVSQQLKLGMFDETVRYRVERIDAART